jgi:hypothetical protein
LCSAPGALGVMLTMRRSVPRVQKSVRSRIDNAKRPRRRAVEPHFGSVRPSHLHSANGAAASAFATQELAHCSGVTHEETFNVRRLIAGFGLNLPQEWCGVLVCSRREVKGQNVSLETAAVHSDIIVFTAEMTEHSFKLILYCDMPPCLHIDARHPHAIPNWRVHGASILEANRERRVVSTRHCKVAVGWY